ncbi:MAG: 5'-nucleotidase C-terminal domain-containing protein [Geminicoccaceae bacterium]
MHVRRLLLAQAMLAGLLVAGAARAEPTTVTFLHTNDLYEIAPMKGQGGFAPLMTLLREERARNPNTVTTFGGDLLSPSLLSGMTNGEQMIELSNAVGTDVAVPGNHEFDFGPDIATDRFEQSKFPWLGTNVRTADGKPWPGLGELLVKEVGGYKLGFFGVLTPETAVLSSPGPTVTFADPTVTARDSVAKLREMGADLVVALTHQDFAQDRALIEDVPGIDIVLGGHDHDPMTLLEGQRLIVKAGSDAHYLAAVDIVLDRVKDKEGKESVTWRPAWRYLSTAGVAPDPKIETLIDSWNKRLAKELDEPVGETAVELDSRRGTVRKAESNLGNLITDAMRAATGADIALTNGGGIRGDRTYPAGAVLTRKDVLNELPFGNVTVLIEIKGSDLLAALENGVSAVQDGGGRFPQVSGMTITYDPAKPVGARILSVMIGGAPLVPDRVYKLATNDYMYRGGDGYGALKAGKPLIDASGGRLMASTVIDYITAQGGKIAPAVEGRIKRAG